MSHRNTIEKVIARTERVGDCHLWTGSKNPKGYGTVMYLGKKWLAHRLVYTELIGPIPDGLEVDHICHSEESDCRQGTNCPHRCCLNVLHMRLKSHAENAGLLRRPKKTRCPAGHSYAEWGKKKRGTTICILCNREQSRRRYKESRQKAAKGE